MANHERPREWTETLESGEPVYCARRNGDNGDERICFWLPGHIPLKKCEMELGALFGQVPDGWTFLGHTYGMDGQEQTMIEVSEVCLIPVLSAGVDTKIPLGCKHKGDSFRL